MFYLRVSANVMFLLSMAVDAVQINMGLTDWDDGTEKSLVSQRDCLYMSGWLPEANIHEIILYCLNEYSPPWNISKTSDAQFFTFGQLSRLNITSEQLYLWSAPMDTIESYQFYLNEHSASSGSINMPQMVYYNCTLPRFGSSCQYSFDHYHTHHLTLPQIINATFRELQSQTRQQICYTHLNCNLGNTSLCIQWNHICDEIIQCIDGVDEQHCWQLETNQCNDDEYQCMQGQCIAWVFFRDGVPDCLDKSDEPTSSFGDIPTQSAPAFRLHEIICSQMSAFNPTLDALQCHDTYAWLYPELLFSEKPSNMNDICWLALGCHFQSRHRLNLNCDDTCNDETCSEIIQNNCPNMFYMPNAPVAFGHIYLAYTKTYFMEQNQPLNEPEYICYNEQFCNSFDSDGVLIFFHNTTCRRPQDFPLDIRVLSFDPAWWRAYVAQLSHQLRHCNTILRNDTFICTRTTLYQCLNSSKCIPKQNLFDGVVDCDYKDDENYTLLISNNDTDFIGTLTMHVYCPISNKSISRKSLLKSDCRCDGIRYDRCPSSVQSHLYVRKHISFPTICDGMTELDEVLIDGQYQTDETKCEQWLCNNVYTRCNGIWNCLDGADEADCYPSALLNCSFPKHLCFSSNTGEYMCLPLNRTNDGHIDCLGGFDEQELCGRPYYGLTEYNYFSCNHSDIRRCLPKNYLCDGIDQCLDLNDEKFCANITYRALSTDKNRCDRNHSEILSPVEEFLCNIIYPVYQPERIEHFLLEKVKQSSIDLAHPKMINTWDSTTEKTRKTYTHCHRSLPLRVWSNNTSNITCLCLPYYYGDRCQYQNDRVNLVMRFEAYSDSWRTPFSIVVKLIDDTEEQTIHSSDQITYLHAPNCKTTYVMDLLYSPRVKDQSKQYSVHIDFYEKISLAYRGSSLLPLVFPFLPVQRLAVLLPIPHTDFHFKTCSEHQCIHGQCSRYFNDPHGKTFCQCHPGWSGQYCTIPYRCSCASDSICLGNLANNRSICLCPVHRWSPRCLLEDTVCQDKATCRNGGQCVPSDRYRVSEKPFECICTDGFFGERCAFESKKIILSFDQSIVVPQSILIHFIEVKSNAAPGNGTTFKTLLVKQDSVSISWSHPFHIAFVEFYPNTYYLITVQKAYDRQEKIEKRLESKDRCVHIREVLNDTIVNFHLLHRIKYYHLPCQQTSPLLTCFYDDNDSNGTYGHFCLCQDFGQQRQANCFEYDHKRKYDCQGHSNCENGAQCLQDNSHCPTISMCICSSCFYGARCQFSTNGFHLSLDALLGYHIQPRTSINDQTTIVKASVTLTVLITIFGVLDAVLSIITFVNKSIRLTGCGSYLLVASINTLFTVTLLSLKFWILINTQITYTTNRLFLQLQCNSIDFLLRLSLNLSQWLTTCVAIERVMIIVQGIKFNKQRSRKIAVYTVPILFVFICATLVQDPIYRRLIDETFNDEKRIWCIISYPAKIRTFDLMMNLFHFIIPFLINLISAIIIIIKTATLRSTVQSKKDYQELLRKQLRKHKHFLITPILLVNLALPRLIISATSGCMNSAGDSWLFLIGYYISFFPSILTFVIFILPSKTYTAEFSKSMKNYRKTTQRHISWFFTKPIDSHRR